MDNEPVVQSISPPSLTHQSFGAKLCCALALCVCVTVISGCRSPVQREVYSKRMANEIRVLEDQLYDADYQNRVLRDELTRVKQDCEPTQVVESTNQSRIFNAPGETSYGPAIPPAPVHEYETPLSDNGVPYHEPSYSDASEGNPFVDDTTPIESGAVFPGETIVDESLPRSPDSVPYVPAPNYDSTQELDAATSPDGASSNKLEIVPTPSGEHSEELPAPLKSNELVPPSAPEPPGPETFKAKPLLPGEPMPPTPSGVEVPDGQISLPKNVNDLIYTQPNVPAHSAPEHIQLHPALSGGHQFDQDDEVDGMYLVINVVDSAGHAVNLRNFDINASLTVVVLDPLQDPSTSRVGRWDFESKEIDTFIRSIPVDGLHVPIKWQSREPIGEDVIVHVRLQAEDEEMRCQGTIKLKRNNVMAKWLPRGEKIVR